VDRTAGPVAAVAGPVASGAAAVAAVAVAAARRRVLKSACRPAMLRRPMDAVLLLSSGEVFRGKSFGAAGEACGELVFNTCMTGYQEVLSDPSYRGQIVAMTYPMVGNYGVNEEDFESGGLHLAGFVVREYCDRPSGHRATRTLGQLLKEKRVVGLCEVDTRHITRILRTTGCMQAVIATGETDLARLTEKLAAAPPIEGRDLVREVATRRAYRFREKLERSWYTHARGLDLASGRGPARNVAILDFGMKTNIARLVTALGARVTVFPPDTPASTVLAGEFDGVVLSNGPGDPTALGYAVETARRLVERLPVFGICLGHQLLGLAMGGRITKLKFGHHGGNHPVKELQSGRVLITSQNHNYAVEADSLEPALSVTHVNLNDGTVEGLAHATLPVFSIQYHPEASPGPHDALCHFRRFFEAMAARSAAPAAPRRDGLDASQA
jgi:carbamoyl-phosphate synthase small subunit